MSHRDKMLVEKQNFPNKQRAVGTQQQTHCVPTARCLVWTHNILPTFYP